MNTLSSSDGSSPDNSDSPQWISRTSAMPTMRELILIACVIVFAIAVRFWGIQNVDVEHFDEGVYASNLWFGEEHNYQYPKRPFYAPPLLPTLVEATMTTFGANSLGVLGVNLLAGVLTVLAVWWLARSWFGAEAGFAAAVLCASSDFHIAYSRTVLTDPLLLFWLVCAVYAGWFAIEKTGVKKTKQTSTIGDNRAIGWSLFAGGLTALAWWTKYNGWLPLAILMSAYIAWRIINRSQKIKLVPSAIQLTIIIITAILLWSPYLYSLQEIGGYAAISANHRQYLVGFEGWTKSFSRQIANLNFFDSPLSMWGVIFALNSPFFFGNSKQPSLEEREQSSNIGMFFLYALPIVCVGILGLTAALFSITLIMLFRSIPQFFKRETDEQTAEDLSVFPLWLLAAWFLGLLLSTPFYTPYPRLVLPLLACLWIGGGWGLATLAQFVFATQQVPSPKRLSPAMLQLSGFKMGTQKIVLFAIAGVLVVVFSLVNSLPVKCWESREGLRTISQQVVKKVEEIVAADNLPTEQIVIYTYAEPSIYYHISAADKIAGAAGSLEFASPDTPRLPVPTFLVVGPHANRSEQFQKEWALYQDQFVEQESYQYNPSVLVRLNNAPPAQVQEDIENNHRETIKLYRLKK